MTKLTVHRRFQTTATAAMTGRTQAPPSGTCAEGHVPRGHLDPFSPPRRGASTPSITSPQGALEGAEQSDRHREAQQEGPKEQDVPFRQRACRGSDSRVTRAAARDRARPEAVGAGGGHCWALTRPPPPVTAGGT